MVSIVFAVIMAVATAHRRWGRRIAGSMELLLASTPSFWLGIVLLFIFSFTLRWFPVAGDRSFSSLVLPALSLGLAQGAVIAQVLRRGLEDALDEPFALTLRAWGIGNTHHSPTSCIASCGFACGNPNRLADWWPA